MVLRAKPTPTRFLTNIPYTLRSRWLKEGTYSVPNFEISNLFFTIFSLMTCLFFWKYIFILPTHRDRRSQP